MSPIADQSRPGPDMPGYNYTFLPHKGRLSLIVIFVSIGILPWAFAPLLLIPETIRERSMSLLIFISLGGGYLFAFFGTYFSNAATFLIKIENDRIVFRNVLYNYSFDLQSLTSVGFVGGLRGWDYIAFSDHRRVGVISNMMFFDSEFGALKSAISDWLAKFGRSELLDTDMTAKGNLGSPPFIKRGFLKILAITAGVYIVLGISVFAFIHQN